MMALGPRARKVTVVAIVAILVTGLGFVAYRQFLSPKTITAYFTSATAIYPGDEVRVVGVRVGTIDEIEPLGTRTRVTLKVDRDVPVPADAKAIIVAPNLVSARYVQLTPAYGASPESSGATMSDGAEIGEDRTAIPVEWDDIKEQLTRLAAELGPASGISGTSLGRFIDSTADAMAGNGDRLRETITQLSDVGRVLGEGSGDIVGVIKNLQVFVTALRDSNTQIVQFQDRLADVTSVVDGSRSDLDSAITELSMAVGKVQRFVAGSRDQTAEQIERLANVTQVLSDNSMAVKNILHAAPNALVNGYNIYNPDSGGPRGSFAMNNFSNPVATVCSAIAAVENVTAAESGKACAQYLGPALRLMNFNHLPFPFNAYLGPAPKNVIYSDPNLAPGGAGAAPLPAEIAPAVSAYTGAGDVPPPPGWTDPPQPPGAYAPNGLPAARTPALYPGAPIPPGVPAPPAPAASNLTELLLPAEAGAAAPAPGGTP
jgi:phospholipid/cholesterol/gamma-HCH transport system substrate-binding protein